MGKYKIGSSLVETITQQYKDKGLSINVIAGIHGASPRTISKVLRENGIVTGRKKPSN